MQDDAGLCRTGFTQNSRTDLLLIAAHTRAPMTEFDPQAAVGRNSMSPRREEFRSAASDFSQTGMRLQSSSLAERAIADRTKGEHTWPF
jgi:hypothetical protein